MLRLFAHRRHWTRRRDGPAPAYAIVCACGREASGKRQARRQVVRCSSCGRGVFVLACSPLPSPDEPLTAESHAGRRLLGAWRVPLVAAMATLLILTTLFAAFVPFLFRPAPPREANSPPEFAARAAAGRRALAEGDFHLAAQELQAALDQDRGRPGALTAAERSDLIQLGRQSDLLARLSSQSLQEIVQEADLVRHEDEWKARFANDYQGKTVVFDDVVRFEEAAAADGRRRPVLAYYRVTVGGRDVRLALEDVTLLQALARERPQRMLFGVRLSAVERGTGGLWVVRFEPDGGVLLTDRGAAEAVCPAPLDPELIDVLKRQDEWIKRRPASGEQG